MSVRRHCLGVVVVTVLLLGGCSRDAAEPAVGPARVEAGGETLVGIRIPGTDQQAGFFGIPYAAAPVGDLRFEAPRAHDPRKGEQDATGFGAACPQLQGNPDWYRMVARGVGVAGDVIPNLDAISEDCLTLNIWTANLQGPDPQPVLVWIHGGSNRNGFSTEPNYQGHKVAEAGVVHVSINYRLGVLGFLSHPVLSQAAPDGVSGNYGLLDQIAALEWIRDNISAFGGDPAQVTIAGESAGASDVGYLIASPRAKGLFKRAILQSGAVNMVRNNTSTRNDAAGVQLAEALGADQTEAAIAALRSPPAMDLVQLATTAITGRSPGVVAGGSFLPQSAYEILEEGSHNPVDILIGSNAQEWLMYFPTDAGDADYDRMLARFGGENGDQFRALLDQADLGIREKMDLMLSGNGFHCPSTAFAGAITRHGGAAYVYRFSRVRPGAEALMAYHGAEIPYVFDTHDDWLPADDVDAALTRAMFASWMKFVKTGDPNTGEGVHWPLYNAVQRSYIDFGDEIVAGADLDREFCALMNKTWREKRGKSEGS